MNTRIQTELWLGDNIDSIRDSLRNEELWRYWATESEYYPKRMKSEKPLCEALNSPHLPLPRGFEPHYGRVEVGQNKQAGHWFLYESEEDWVTCITPGQFIDWEQPEDGIKGDRKQKLKQIAKELIIETSDLQIFALSGPREAIRERTGLSYLLKGEFTEEE